MKNKKLVALMLAGLACLGVAGMATACGVSEEPGTEQTQTTQYSVTVDGKTPVKVDEGKEYTLPSASEAVVDANFTFTGWSVNDGTATVTKQPGDKIVIKSNVTITSLSERKAPEVVVATLQKNVAEGGSVDIAVADYVKAYGADVTVVSADPAKVGVTKKSDGVYTVSGLASTAGVNVTISCGSVSSVITVAVKAGLTVTIDGGTPIAVVEGDSYTLPAASEATISDANHEFKCWAVNTGSGNVEMNPGQTITVTGHVTITTVQKRKDPVVVLASDEKVVGINGTVDLSISDYITAYGADVTVESADEDKVLAEAEDGLLVIAGVALTGATPVKVTLTCGSAKAEISVSVKTSYAVTVDHGMPMLVAEGEEYTLPAATAATLTDDNYEFVAWKVDDGTTTVNKQPGEKIIVNSNVSLETVDKRKDPVVVLATDSKILGKLGSMDINVADYITVYGASYTVASADETKVTVTEKSAGVYTLTGVAATTGASVNVTITCGSATSVIAVTVSSKFTVTVDNSTTVEKEEGESYILPAASEAHLTDSNFEFEAWLVNDGTGAVEKQPGDTITVSSNVTVTTKERRKAPVVIQASDAKTLVAGNTVDVTVADYITVYGADYTVVSADETKVTVAEKSAGVYTLTAVASTQGAAVNVTVTCGTATVTVAVTVKGVYTVTVEDGTPVTRTEGESYTLPAANVANITDANFEFVGWLVNDGTNEEVKDAGAVITVNSNVTVTAKTQRKAPVVIQASDAKTLVVGNTVDVTVADYITVYGADYTVESADGTKVTVTEKSAGVYTISGVAVTDGAVNVTVTCGTATVTIAVEVVVPAYANKEISFDLFDAASGECEIEKTSGPDAQYSFEFDGDHDGVEISGNKIVHTATAAHAEASYTVNVKSPAGTVLTSFTVKCTVTDTRPTLKNAVVEVDGVVDITEAAYELDLAGNINGNDKIASYTVNGSADGIANGKYTISEGYTDVATLTTFTVKAVMDNAAHTELEFTVKVTIKNIAPYKVRNGGFTDGLDGWTLTNTVADKTIGDIRELGKYWKERVAFGNDGKFFSCYIHVGNDEHGGDTSDYLSHGDEDAKGTLTSSNFKVSDSGWITYKLGGAKNIEQVYVEIVSVTNSGKSVKLPHFEFSDADCGGCKLVAYKANLKEWGFEHNEEVFLRITDDATGDYGLFFFDSLETYYTSEPDFGSYCTPYRLYNGGFETGNFTGWTKDGNIGWIGDANGYWGVADKGEISHQKEGRFFMQGGEDKQNTENDLAPGSIKSSNFKIGGSGWMTFRMGTAAHADVQYIEVVTVENRVETVVGRYTNTEFVDAGNVEKVGNNGISALTLIKFKADLSAHIGKTAFIRIVDNWMACDFGFVLADDFVTYYASTDDIPAGYNLAENKIVNE